MASERTVTLVDADFNRHVLVCSGEPYHLRTDAAIHGLAPYAVSSTAVADIPGEVVGQVKALPRQIAVPILVKATDELTVDEYLGNLGRVLQPKEPCSIIFERPDGTVREIVARYTSGGEAVNVPTYQTTHVVVRLIFTAFDPYWRSITTPEKTYTEPFENGFFALMNSFYLDNEGDVPVWPTWTFTGAAEGVLRAVAWSEFDSGADD